MLLSLTEVLADPLASTTHAIAYAYVLIELVFFLFCRLLNELQPALQADDAPPFLDREGLLERIIDEVGRSPESVRQFYSGWFFDTPSEQLSRGDIRNFWAWAAYLRHSYSELDATEQGTVDAGIDKMCARAGLDPPTGDAPTNAEFAGHTIAPVKSWHWPLAMYAIIYAVAKASSCSLWLRGFQRHRTPTGFSVWVRHRRYEHSSPNAFVFVSGIGVGIGPYLLQFLSRFRSDTQVLVSLPWVSFRFTRTIPTLMDAASDLHDVLVAEGIERITFCAHSYGSFLAAECLQRPDLFAHDGARRPLDPPASRKGIDSPPVRIVRAIMISPPAMHLFRPNTTRSALYGLQHFWTETSLARVLFRHLHWYRCALVASDLPTGSIVVLMELDPLIDVAAVEADVLRHVDTRDLSVMVQENTGHGFYMVWPRVCARVVRHVKERTEHGRRREVVFKFPISLPSLRKRLEGYLYGEASLLSVLDEVAQVVGEADGVRSEAMAGGEMSCGIPGCECVQNPGEPCGKPRNKPKCKKRNKHE